MDKWQEAGENHESSIIWTVHQILLDDQIKEDEIDGACSTNACNFFFEKPKWKKPLGLGADGSKVQGDRKVEQPIPDKCCQKIKTKNNPKKTMFC
jgi:hypothetical protein